ncbi:ATP-binding protein [uncultured Roseovarius sp.]|uniref:sensor histidine kinase n=1 Tax=uncultured Roseovarius sp. TaxID=293344 RepID=UPI002611D5DE|nr:ATP-binding protein [uncultured Roseovarius sp.]
MFPAKASLKLKFGFGAGLLGLVALMAAGMTVFGSDKLSARINATLAAERRIDRYAVLSTQISSFIVVAAEAIQSGLPPEARASRLNNLSDNIRNTFARIRSDLETAVEEARALGIDEQSRRATQSIGIARMEALFESSRNGFLADTTNREKLVGFIDTFSIGFDPLLNAVITDEVRARDKIIASVAELRRSLTSMAMAISVVTLLLLVSFYLLLIRPQFRRLDQLQAAARQIGQGDFTVTLPDNQHDEIGRLFGETNRMTHALATRKDEVDQEWAKLNDTISERTEALHQANASLAKIDEDRRRFFADISHELRTPLTVILMETQLGLKGTQNAKTSFETIQNRALRLNRRIDDLLRIARSESGQLALESEPFDLTEIVNQALSDTNAELCNANLEVSHSPQSTMQVIGDKNWIRQVLTGLIQNAIRHARSGGRLSISCEAHESCACVSIADNGPGIAPAAQAKIFERFQQGDSSAKSEGFGIGLALAKWVVDQQNGTISIKSPLSDDDKLGDAPGTKVTVCIPLAQD